MIGKQNEDIISKEERLFSFYNMKNTSKNMRSKKVRSFNLEEHDTTFERSIFIEWKRQNLKSKVLR